MIATALKAGHGSLIRIAEADSTNTLLLANPFGDMPRDAFALWADRQGAGRGRRGREWIAAPGAALTFSVALEQRITPRTPPPAAFSLVVGCLLRERLVQMVDEGADEFLRLKWPNDLLLGGRKLAGILIETRRQGGIERVVVGIGLNLRPHASLPDTAASLHSCCPHWGDDDSRWLVGAMRDDLDHALVRFRRHGLSPWRDAWHKADAFAGQRVSLRDGQRLIAEGVADGVSAAGALRLAGEGGVGEFMVGELSARVASSGDGGVRE